MNSRAILFLAATLALPAGGRAQPALDAARAYREQHGPEILRSFADLLELAIHKTKPVGIRSNEHPFAVFLFHLGAASGSVQGYRAIIGYIEVQGSIPVDICQSHAHAARATG